jgi:hypothetical protein
MYFNLALFSFLKLSQSLSNLFIARLLADSHSLNLQSTDSDWFYSQLFSGIGYQVYLNVVYHFFSLLKWGETESTWYIGHYLAYFTSLR